MGTPSQVQMSLVDVADSVLVVIDIQDHFLAKYDRAKVQDLVGKVVWLLHVAHHLDVPVVAMAEDIGRNGGLTRHVADALPSDTVVHDKDFFGLAGNPEILAALTATGRRTAVLVGMETDVCVAQTALGLIAQGYRVAVVQDAVASMAADEAVGLGRMRDAGAAITATKALYYEWTRSVSRVLALENSAPHLEALRPATLVL